MPKKRVPSRTRGRTPSRGGRESNRPKLSAEMRRQLLADVREQKKLQVQAQAYKNARANFRTENEAGGRRIDAKGRFSKKGIADLWPTKFGTKKARNLSQKQRRILERGGIPVQVRRAPYAFKTGDGLRYRYDWRFEEPPGESLAKLLLSNLARRGFEQQNLIQTRAVVNSGEAAVSSPGYQQPRKTQIWLESWRNKAYIRMEDGLYQSQVNTIRRGKAKGKPILKEAPQLTGDVKQFWVDITALTEKPLGLDNDDGPNNGRKRTQRNSPAKVSISVRGRNGKTSSGASPKRPTKRKGRGNSGSNGSSKRAVKTRKRVKRKK